MNAYKSLEYHPRPEVKPHSVSEMILKSLLHAGGTSGDDRLS